MISIAASPTNADLVYVAGVNGGVWKTTNATATNPTWTPLTDRMNVFAIDDNQVFRSTDGGATWSDITGNLVTIGQAFSFDGVDDYVNVPDVNNLDFTTDFTIDAWVYQTAQQSSEHVVVGKGRSATGTGYALAITNGQAGLAPIGSPQQATAATALSYDPATGRYTYTWKTNKSWANTCRQFTLRLTDNTDHLALFKFK